MPAETISAFPDAQWRELLYALRRGNCVVLTGPNFAVKTENDRTLPLLEWLALRLAGLLEAEGRAIDPHEKGNLRYAATEYLRLKGNTSLQEQVEQFYKENERQVSPLHELLSQLPVSLVVNTTPDTLLARAFKEQYKPVRTAWYSLSRDRDQAARALELEDPASDNPLIYNLFGSVAQPESLVLTEKDQLNFLEDVIQHNNAIPNAVLKNLGEKKVYLFLGFNFDQWQLRILLRLLRLGEQQLSAVLAPGNGELPRSAAIFFQNQYKLSFPPHADAAFLAELAERAQAPEEAENTPAQGVEVLYLYDAADEALKKQLDQHLAVLRQHERINTWDESQLAAGSEIEAGVAARIARAGMILLLVSADFLASDRIYNEQLQLALARHRRREAVICPVLVRPCSWEGASFAKLPTVLPRNKKAATIWDNQDEAFRHIAKELEGFLDILLENLQRPA